MDKDRAVICNIISDMLDSPDKYEIYPTSTAYTRLEHYIESVRAEALGYAHGYFCILLDKGKDPRTEAVPNFFGNAIRDLNTGPWLAQSS